MKQPFLPLFFGDLLASTGQWLGEERALYILALAYQWTGGPLPKDHSRICRMVQYERPAFDQLWQTVGKKFVEQGDGLVNLRLEEHREKSQQMSAARAQVGRKGGQASVQAKAQAKGQAIASGLLEQNSTIHPIPSYPIQIQSKKERKAPPFDLDSITGLDRATFEKWLAYRKEIGKALKPASIEAAARDMARYGSQQAVVVQQSIAQGWQGLFAIKVVTGAQVPADPEGLALKKLTDRRQAIGLASFRLPNAHELSKDYRAAQDKAWMEAKSEKAEEPAPVDTSRNVARVSGLLQGFGRMGVAK